MVLLSAAAVAGAEAVIRRALAASVRGAAGAAGGCSLGTARGGGALGTAEGAGATATAGGGRSSGTGGAGGVNTAQIAAAVIPPLPLE